jgi:galactonate dehydratase
MRITAVRPFVTQVGSYRPQCLVKVETDAGISGWGESGLSGREEAVVGAVAHFREFLVGADPMARGALWQRLYRSQYFEGGSVLTAAMSAIDIALYDIAGKALGVPVYELLGGRQRDYVPLFAVTLAEMGPPLIEAARLLLDNGWNVIRFAPGAPGHDTSDLFEPRDAIWQTAEWATRLREAVGTGPILGIDWHHRLSVPEAASFCQKMPPGTLDFLEEPIRAENPDAYVQLRGMIDVPLAIGEEFASKWAFLPFIERGLTDFIRIDICNVGGFTEAVKVAGWAEAHYLDLMPHNPLGPICMAATGHLLTASPNVAWMEFRESPTEPDLGFYDPLIFPVQPRREGPRMFISDAPGLGVEVDEARLTDRAPHWNPPQLRRADGSVQNW